MRDPDSALSEPPLTTRDFRYAMIYFDADVGERAMADAAVPEPHCPSGTQLRGSTMPVELFLSRMATLSPTHRDDSASVLYCTQPRPQRCHAVDH